jgi:hypothetical protein
LSPLLLHLGGGKTGRSEDRLCQRPSPLPAFLFRGRLSRSC